MGGRGSRSNMGSSNNKKGLSQASKDTLRGIKQGERQRQRRNEANRRAVRRGMGL